MQVESTPLMVANTYATMRKNLEVVRKRVGRPLTLWPTRFSWGISWTRRTKRLNRE